MGSHRGLVAYAPCLLLLGALSASADTIVYNGNGPGGGIDVSVVVANTSINEGGFAGQCSLTDTNAPAATRTFYGYCVDIYHSFGDGASWTANPLGTLSPDSTNQILTNNPSLSQDLAWLYNKYNPSTSAPDTAAALQFALWAEEYKGTAGFVLTGSGSTTSATAGPFTLTQYGSDGTELYNDIVAANAMLSALSTANVSGQLATFYNVIGRSSSSSFNESSQDFIAVNVPGFTPNVIPEPNSFLLLTAGLGALALGARKVRRAHPSY